MQNYRIGRSVRVLTRLLFKGVGLICVCLCTVGVFAGTLEDIRTKAGWKPPVHSKHEVAYCPLVTPAELLAYLDKYHRNTIKMQVLFYKITTRGLNVWLGARRMRHKWSSKKYISFAIKDPLGQVRHRDIYLFLNKDNPDKKTLLQLTLGRRITITGLVKNINWGNPWIEVTKIDVGWEE